MEEDGSGRPRRPDAEILSYVRSLEGLIGKHLDQYEKGGAGSSSAKRDNDEGGSDDEGEEEGGEDNLLIQNLVDELEHKFASVSMDRHAAPVMEKVARLCSRQQLARLLNGCVGYAHCLATNRYSSHVLQTLLSLVGPLLPLELENGPVEDEDKEEREDDQTRVTLEEAAVKFAQELHSSTADLMQDISGTHTIRALFCLLTGMPLVAEKRGRHSKHQHSIDSAISVHAGGQKGAHSQSGGGDVPPQRVKLEMYAVPDAFHMMLESVVKDLAALSLVTLHEAVAHPYSGPALCLLVQAVARSEGGDRLELSNEGPLMGLVKKALCWDKPDRCAEVVYAMSGEAVGSRFLESLLWYLPAPMVGELFHRCVAGSVLEFVRDDVANFVIQAFLQRTSSADDVGVVLDELADHFKELMEGRRAGVVWRLTGACIRLKTQEKRVAQLAMAALGFPDAKARRSGRDGEQESVVHALLQPKVGEDGRLNVNVPGARLLECFLRMRQPVSRDLSLAVTALCPKTLEAVAKDNVASRAVVDPLLAQCEVGGEEALQVAEALGMTWKGRYAELAVHPVGFHVLTRCFTVVGNGVKAGMVEECMAAESRLAGSHFGRRALSALAVPLFRANRLKWEATMKTGEKKKKVLEELFTMIDTEAATKGKKRRRKEEEAGHEDEGEGEGAAVKLDPFEALLSGKVGRKEGKSKGTKASKDKKAASGERKAKGNAGKEGKSRKDGGEKQTQDMDFILQAIKGTVAEEPGKAAKKAKEGKKRDGRVVALDGEKRTQAKEHKDGGKKRREPQDEEERVERMSKKKRPTVVTPLKGEAPVEKARRILGDRVMMSKFELMNAVAELESDVKKGGKGSKSKAS